MLYVTQDYRINAITNGVKLQLKFNKKKGKKDIAKDFYLYTCIWQTNLFYRFLFSCHNSRPLSIFSCYTSELYLHYILDIAMNWIEINMSAYEYEKIQQIYNHCLFSCYIYIF